MVSGFQWKAHGLPCDERSGSGRRITGARARRKDLRESCRGVIRRLLLLLVAAAIAQAQTESPTVVGVGPFLHIVSDLDQSLAFYHDELGLELSGPAGEHKFTDNPAVANLYGVPGKQFRAAVLKIPGSAMGIELVQWG